MAIWCKSLGSVGDDLDAQKGMGTFRWLPVDVGVSNSNQESTVLAAMPSAQIVAKHEGSQSSLQHLNLVHREDDWVRRCGAIIGWCAA